MLASFFLTFFSFQTHERSIVPEIEWNFSASDRGGSDFRIAALDHLPHSDNSKNGGSEQVFRIGCAILQPISPKLDLTAGLHFGYASGNSMGDALRSAGTYRDTSYASADIGEQLDMKYFLADIQLGVRYWKWDYVGLGFDIDVERGLWGNYNWKDLSGNSYQKGAIGGGGESSIKFPIKYYLKFGPVFKVANYGWIYPWFGFGSAPLMTSDSYVSSQKLGLKRSFSETEGFIKGKFGIKIGYSI